MQTRSATRRGGAVSGGAASGGAVSSGAATGGAVSGGAATGVVVASGGAVAGVVVASGAATGAARGGGAAVAKRTRVRKVREASPDPPPPSPDAPPLTREAYAVAVDTTRTANTLLRNAINTGDEASVLDALHKAWELWKTCGRYIAKDSRVPPELRSHFKQLETRLWYDVGFFSADAMRDLERKEESPTSRMRVVMITLEVACDLERELEEVTALLPPA